MSYQFPTTSRPKGAKYMRNSWIGLNYQLYPIEGMTTHHLVIVMNLLEKWAADELSQQRSDAFRDMQKYPAKKEIYIKRIDIINNSNKREHAKRIFKLWHDIANELTKRHVNYQSEKVMHDHMSQWVHHRCDTLRTWDHYTL